MRKWDKYIVHAVCMYMCMCFAVAEHKRRFVAELKRNEIASCWVFISSENAQTVDNFTQKPSHWISLKNSMSEWNKHICLFIGFNMVALLCSLCSFFDSFLFDSHRTFFFLCIVRSAFLSCFYGNKYTITNTEATVKLYEGKPHCNRVHFSTLRFI